MDKRGQAALEFLMTYGWVILVVLIGISAFVFFGLFNYDVLPDVCLLGSGFACLNPFFQTFYDPPNDVNVGVLHFDVVNMMGKTLDAFYVVVDPEDQYCGGSMALITSDGAPDFGPGSNGTADFRPGDQRDLIILRPGLDLDLDGVAEPGEDEAGIFSIFKPTGVMGCNVLFPAFPPELKWNCCDSDLTTKYFTGEWFFDPGAPWDGTGTLGPGLCEGYTQGVDICFIPPINMGNLKRYSVKLWVYYKIEGSNILHKRTGDFSATHSGGFLGSPVV